MSGRPWLRRASAAVAEIGPAVLLPDGRLFAVGATGATALYTPNANPTLAGTWANGPTLQDAGGNTLFPMDAPAVLEPNGKVLVTAQPREPVQLPGPTTFFEYNPSTNTAPIISIAGEQRQCGIPGTPAATAERRHPVFEQYQRHRNLHTGRRPSGKLEAHHHELPVHLDYGTRPHDFGPAVQRTVSGVQLWRRCPECDQLSHCAAE